MNAIIQYPFALPSARTMRRIALLLLAALALYVLCTAFAHAALPDLPTPEGIDGAAVDEGDWLGAMGGWFKKGIAIFGLVIAGLGFITVAVGALGKWKEYSTNRATVGDLKEYMIMGAVFGIFLIVMITYAFSVFEP